ncbi:MAG: CDP-diacylglycerol--glycerol-3-phosphate 3-phosphatidyltransferase [bacterium]
MYKHIPNLITVSRLLLLPVLIYLLWENNLADGWYAAGLLVIIGVSDLLDGFLARRWDAVSNIGKIIDPAADKLTILVSVMMLLHLNRINVVLAILIISRELVIVTLRAVAASDGVIIQASDEGKRKTALQMFGVGGLFIYYDFFGANAAYCGNVLLVMSVVLSWYSGIKYIRDYYLCVKKNSLY